MLLKMLVRMKSGQEIQLDLLRKRFADETIEKLEKIQWWNFNDSELEQLGHLVMNVDKFLEKAER